MPLRRASSRLLNRAVGESRLREDLDVAVVLDAAVGAVYLRLLLVSSPHWVVRVDS